MKGFFLILLVGSNLIHAQNLVIDTLKYNNLDSLANVQLSDSLEQDTADLKVNTKNDFDKLYLFNDDILVVNIIKTNQNEILYKYPLNHVINHINRNEINKIEYSYGKLEILNIKNSSQNSDSASWQDVNLIYNPAQAKDLIEIKKVSAKFECEKLKESKDILLRNTEIIIAKKAFNSGANTVLISNTYIHKVYGELPYVILEGIAYKQN